MRPKLHPADSDGFSLTEVLVVMAITGLLAVLAGSSISSLRSTALSTAGNQMVDVFAMARQNSISKGDYTAVVIQTAGTRACSAYTLLELPRQSNGTQDLTLASSWSQLTQWRFLPKGVVFENNQSNDTFMAAGVLLNTATQPPMLPSSLPSSYAFQGSQINLTSGVVVQCYQPDGTLIGTQSLALRLIEGTANSSGNTTNTSGADYYDLYFLANTGTTKIGRP